jgi:hypothetical protein
MESGIRRCYKSTRRRYSRVGRRTSKGDGDGGHFREVKHEDMSEGK